MFSKDLKQLLDEKYLENLYHKFRVKETISALHQVS